MIKDRTNGRIEAFTEPEFSGWWALREKTDDGINHEIGSGDGGLFEPDARRLAACWNACDGFDTDLLLNIEMMGDTIKQRFEGMQAEVRRVDALEADTRTKLAAARARIDTLEAAIDKLAACKGRYHTEANFNELLAVRNAQ